MKFVHLIEYKKRNIFLKRSFKNVVEKLVPDTFIKIKIEQTLNREFEMIKFVYNICPIQGLPKYIKTNVPINFYLKRSFFKKIKKDLKLASLSHFLHDF